MKMVINNFVLITPRAVSPAGTFPRIHPPLGAISILSEVQRAGFACCLIDSAAEGLKQGQLDSLYQPTETENLDGVEYWKTGLKLSEVIARLDKIQPDVIGVSCATIVDRGEVSRLVKGLKEVYPTTPIILGGHEASFWYREILGETIFPIETIPGVDYIVVGPGQPVVADLLKYLADPFNREMPAGVAYRKDNKVVFTGVVNFLPNNHSLPNYDFIPRINLPGREKPLDIYSYIGNPHAGRIATFLSSSHPISYFPLLTSYGCGFDCRFCDTDRNLIRYAVDNVIKIIEGFKSIFDIDYIDFIDNNFGGGNSLSRSIASEILSFVSREGYQIGFSNGLTFESMARNNYSLIEQFAKDGNVKHIAFPCENGNDRILKMVRKPHNLELVRKVLNVSKILSGTNREGFFIGGFPASDDSPAETPQEVENTLKLIHECLEDNMLHQAIFLTLSPVTREYRLIWRNLYPTAPFEHCLFSKKTGIWPYDNSLLDDAHERVNLANQKLGLSVTRKL